MSSQPLEALLRPPIELWSALTAGSAALTTFWAPQYLMLTESLSYPVSFGLGLLAVVRPVAQRHLHTPRAIRTGVAALVGAEAEVLESVSARDGRIKLSGEIWSARSYDGNSEFAPGDSVRVIEISGATALVG